MDVKGYLNKPVSPFSLGLFRILFALLLLVQLARLQPYIVDVLPKSLFFLKYPGLEWVDLISAGNLQLVFGLGYLLCALLALGVYSRIVSALLVLIWGYLFFVDAGHYNNHYYLVLLLLVLFAVTHSGAVLGVLPKLRKTMIPNWQLLVFRFQIVVVYFFGGLAKLNEDWLNAAPMKIWLSLSQYEFLQAEWIAYFICWFGLVFDLSIGFLLWNRKTRVAGLALLLPFHISNHFIWHIGIFPWLMIAATVLFFDMDWLKKKVAKKPTGNYKAISPTWVKGFLIIYICFQLFFPLRQWFFEGPSYWTGYCFRFSWNMMLYDNLETFKVKVSVPDEGVVGYIDMNRYVNNKQYRKLNQYPGNLSRLCQFLGNEMKTNAGIANPELNIITYRSINGRPYQLFVDTTINMVKADFSPYKVPEWILPFNDTEYLPENLQPNNQEGLRK